jgi:hypothetical protein
LNSRPLEIKLQMRNKNVYKVRLEVKFI